MARRRRKERQCFFSDTVLTQRENPKSGNRPSGSTIPQSPSCQLRSPFTILRANFSCAADLRARRTNGDLSLWQGRRTRLTPGSEVPVQHPLGSGISISRRGCSIFRRDAAAPLLFPRLGEINSRCLRVFATGGISPFIDCRPFDRVLLLISVGILRDTLPEANGGKEEKT